MTYIIYIYLYTYKDFLAIEDKIILISIVGIFIEISQ